jgi:DNA-binding CsgD family transcriptional regulator
MLAEAEAQLERHDPVGLLVVVDAMQVEVARFSDKGEVAEAALERCRERLGAAAPLAHQLPYVARAEAWAADLEGDPPRAQRLLLAAAEEMSDSPVHAARLTYEAMRAGADGRRQAEALESFAARCDAGLVGLYSRHASARVDGDGTALMVVADGFEQIGAVRFASEAAANAADAFALEGRDDSARRGAARSLELHAAGQDGPAPAMREMDAEASVLTAREAQLTALAAKGLSNPEIAEQLVLSVRTVESHLYRAMHKLGVKDRHEL